MNHSHIEMENESHQERIDLCQTSSRKHKREPICGDAWGLLECL
jgi:hypothetical protein